MDNLSLQPDQSFESFKKNFYERFPDLSIFNCGDDLNLTKVVLDGLKVGYSSQRKLKPRFLTKPFFKWILLFVRQILFGGRLPSKLKHRILITGTPRPISESDSRLFYFNKFIEAIPEKDVALFFPIKIDNYKNDQFLINAIVSKCHFSENIEELNVLLGLRKKIIDLKPQFSESDFENVTIAIEKFAIQFFVWNRILKNSAIKKAFFDEHYHREGFLYALKINDVEAIELQHGLISFKDIFYVFPKNILPVKEKALFPDKILLFGEYWKVVLLKGFEFTESQIEVIGDFNSYANNLIEEIIDEEKRSVILITSQTLIKEYIWGQTLKMAYEIQKSNLNYVIWYKPHPIEYSDLSYYEIPEELRGLLSIKKQNLEQLLKHALCQVSVYSTSLIDGIRFGVPSYSWDFTPAKDYVDDFVNQGFSTLLSNGTYPWEIDPDSGKNAQTKMEQIFAPLNVEELLKQIN